MDNSYYIQVLGLYNPDRLLRSKINPDMAYLIYGYIYVTEKATKRRGQFVIPVLGQNMLHTSDTTTNLTLYRVLRYGESSGTIFRVPTFVVKSFRRYLSRLGATSIQNREFEV